MSAENAVADSDIITKGEFAKRRQVSPGRVSQWISEKKISGAAIVGEGRSARIRESVACAQLKKTLDPMQLAGNGLGTRLDVAPRELPLASPTDPPADPAPSPSQTAADRFEDQIKAERLAALMRNNRKAAEEEAQRAGRLTDTTEAASEMRRIAGQMLTVFEGSLPELATAISAQWKLPQRDVLHLLRSEFVKVRATASATFRKTAESMPRLVGVEIEESVGVAAE